jgi:hypothetical protein
MGHLFYVLKIGIATFLIVVLMQIEVGHNTIENHAELFIRKSSLFEPARQIAEGGFIALKVVYRKTLNIADSFVTKQFRAENSPGQRKLLEIKRSLAYQKQEEKKVESKDYEESEDLD